MDTEHKKLAMLRAMARDTCPLCALGGEVTIHHFGVGLNTVKHRNGEACKASNIHHRMSQLRVNMALDSVVASALHGVSRKV